MFGFSLMRLGIYAAIAVVALGSLYTGYRVWRHQIWVEGRDAALEEVSEVNQQARQAAQRVKRTIDQCFDEGGGWDVVTGTCTLDGTTPSGIRSLFGND